MSAVADSMIVVMEAAHRADAEAIEMDRIVEKVRLGAISSDANHTSRQTLLMETRAPLVVVFEWVRTLAVMKILK